MSDIDDYKEDIGHIHDAMNQVRKHCLNGVMGGSGEFFWIGHQPSGRNDFTVEVIMRFDNLADWLLNECDGDKEIVRSEIHKLLLTMQRSMYQELGVLTPEEDARLLRSPMHLKAKNAVQGER